MKNVAKSDVPWSIFWRGWWIRLGGNNSKLAGFYSLYAFEICCSVYCLDESWMAKRFEASAVSDLVTLVTRRIHCEGMREGIYFESGVVFRGLLYWCYRDFPYGVRSVRSPTKWRGRWVMMIGAMAMRQDRLICSADPLPSIRGTRCAASGLQIKQPIIQWQSRLGVWLSHAIGWRRQALHCKAAG